MLIPIGVVGLFPGGSLTPRLIAASYKSSICASTEVAVDNSVNLLFGDANEVGLLDAGVPDAIEVGVPNANEVGVMVLVGFLVGFLVLVFLLVVLHLLKFLYLLQ